MFNYLNNSRICFGVFLAFLVSSWLVMPVYPDEIATRISLGRYFQDHHLIMGLYALCSPQGRPLPVFFVPSAWGFALFDSYISPNVARFFAAGFLWFALFVITAYVLRGGGRLAALILSTALIGVAGSGLVLARPEIFQIVAFLTCIGVFWLQDSNRLSLHWHLVGAISVFAMTIASCYSHLQGILFLPLATFIAYRSLSLAFSNKVAIATCVLFFASSIIYTLQLNQPNCHDFPGIENFWKMMMFDPKQISNNYINWIWLKFNGYTLNFIYKKNYTIAYLPGLVVQGWLRNLLLKLLNFSIVFVVLINISATILITFVSFLKLFNSFFKYEFSKNYISDNKTWFFLLLTGAPIIFLFIYDTGQNFYRSFFINLIFAVCFSVWVAEKKLVCRRFLFKIYVIFLVAVLLSTYAINTLFFMERLNSGFEGPSVSLGNFNSSVERDVEELVKVCPISMERGRVVVDDLTYWALRDYPYIYPVTYIQLQAQLAGIGLSQAFKIVAPSVAIVRCASLDSLGIHSVGRVTDLCCSNFNN